MGLYIYNMPTQLHKVLGNVTIAAFHQVCIDLGQTLELIDALHF